MSRRSPDTQDHARGASEGFLQRWSRRKAEASEPEADRPGAGEASSAPPPAEPAKVLTDADMPPIESLNDKSDFSMFLSPGVSEELRRLALRKLFRLPEFNQRFELDGEYYDCTNLEPLGSIITYDMREEMKRAAEKLAQTLGDAEAPRPAGAAASTSISVAAPPDDPPASSRGAVTPSTAPAKNRKTATRRRTPSRRKA